MNIKKDVLKPVAITFAALVLMFVMVLLSLHLWCPYAMAQISYKLGANKLALSYFERDYNTTKNYGVLYNIVNLSIKQEDSEKVITYFEKFLNDSDYNDYIKKIDDKNQNLKVSSLVKSKLLSEDNYLKNRYVFSLAKQKQNKKAFEFALDNTSFNVSENVLEPYLFTYICAEGYVVSDTNYQDVIDNMENYFSNLFSVFKSNYVSRENIVLNFAIGGRINEVGSNLKDLRKLGNVKSSDEQINDVIFQVNQKMALEK